MIHLPGADSLLAISLWPLAMFGVIVIFACLLGFTFLIAVQPARRWDGRE